MIYKKFTDLISYRNSFKEFCEGKDWQEIYSTAYADDLLWLFATVCPDKKRQLVLTTGYIVNTVRHLMTDERSIKAVDGCIAYGKGEINDAELKIIADAAYAAYTASSASSASVADADAAYAAAAAYYAADAAYAAAAYAAAYAAAATAYAAAAAYAAASDDKYLLISADICLEALEELKSPGCEFLYLLDK